MQSKQLEFLGLAGVLPARLTCEQTAWRLNFAEHDIPVLAAAGILRPLGKPASNAPKYYALADVEELASNSKLLDKATAVLQSHWLRKRRSGRLIPQSAPLVKRNGSASPSVEASNGQTPGRKNAA